MNETVQIVFGLIGGLAMFLFGMNSMSDALQKAAGERMKKILGFLTKNPLMGALAGALVTAVLQSSSATTVMVIGFVSAGLMSLPQAISVIFGANIGTTMTAQLLAFELSDYIYPIIFVGFMLNFASKKENVKNLGMVLFSFGLLFEGIEIMGSVMKPLASSPIFIELMGKVSDIPILGVALGMVMTLVVQSSSATIAVLQNFASQAGPDGVSSVIGLAGAIPILLGDNIGTTITALLASIGQSRDAKRTALAHSIFNISGSIICLCVMPLLVRFVQFISPKGNEIDVISRQIANAHTSFNVACTIIWLPLIPVMVKLVTFLVRGSDRKQELALEPKYLDEKMYGQPAAAMFLASKELERLANYTAWMLNDLKEAVIGGQGNEASAKYREGYETVKGLQNHISGYMTKLLAAGSMTARQVEQAAGLLFVSNNMERIADRCEDIAQIEAHAQAEGRQFSESAREDMERCFNIAGRLFDGAVTAVRDGDFEAAMQVAKDKNKMRKALKKCNKAHLQRVEKKKCDPELTAEYTNLLYNLDRMADNCVGIAEEAVDNFSFTGLQVENMREESAQKEYEGQTPDTMNTEVAAARSGGV